MIEPTDKASWRRWALARAAGDGPPDSEAVVAGLRVFLAGVDPAGRWVLTYRPMPGEIDLDPLLAEHRCAVTRTNPGGRLTVHPADGPSERHRFGYLQPSAGSPEVALDEVAVALVPGVVFDGRGVRVGHGAGYYDRLLPGLPPGVPRVGVVRRVLVVAADLPCEPHDVRMTHLATEDGVRAVES